MEKKNTIFSLTIISVIIFSTVAFIIISGITANEYSYVQLEINPRIEFLCDKKQNIVSYNALNEDAKIIISDKNYIGTNIEKATVDFINECAKVGYIDVDGKNALNLTTISGITQALDVHINQSINKYLKENEILCLITNTNQDREIFNEKNKNNISNPNKYKLIKTMIEKDKTLKINNLKKYSEEKLINMVYKNNDKNKKEENKINDNIIKLKKKLMKNNNEKYKNHKSKINKNSKIKFAKKLSDYQKIGNTNFKTNFENEYKKWQNNQYA